MIKLDDDFHSANIDAEEFKNIITEAVADTHPGDNVISVDVNCDGVVEVKLSSGMCIEIEVDWNEIVLK